MILNRRSFLKGSSLSVVTFAVHSVISPIKGMAAAADIVAQKKILDEISVINSVSKIPDGVKLISTAKAEKAFLIGFQRVGNEYAKLLNFVDVVPVGSGFNFSGKIGPYREACSFNFDTNELFTVDFDYMNKITTSVYKSVEFFFGQMSKEERLAANGSATNPSEADYWD